MPSANAECCLPSRECCLSFRSGLLLSFATALLDYHSRFALSTAFSIFFGRKRRKRDLNPRAAWATYTLSRGASSTSWVFLLISNYVSTNINLHPFFVTQIILYRVAKHLSIPFFKKTCPTFFQKGIPPLPNGKSGSLRRRNSPGAISTYTSLAL